MSGRYPFFFLCRGPLGGTRMGRMTTLAGALDALPVPAPTPTRSASWPVKMDTTAFATAMHGALLLLHGSTDGATTRAAVVVEATGADAVRILPSAPQGAASAAYLDEVVTGHVPQCFGDGRDGMEFPTPAGSLRMQWNEGGEEGFQVTVRLAAAQIRREGQLPSAVLGQGPITTALEVAAVPWVPRPLKLGKVSLPVILLPAQVVAAQSFQKLFRK